MKHYSQTELGRARYDVSIKRNRVEKTRTLLKKYLEDLNDAETTLNELETTDENPWLVLIGETHDDDQARPR